MATAPTVATSSSVPASSTASRCSVYSDAAQVGDVARPAARGRRPASSTSSGRASTAPGRPAAGRPRRRSASRRPPASLPRVVAPALTLGQRRPAACRASWSTAASWPRSRRRPVGDGDRPATLPPSASAGLRARRDRRRPRASRSTASAGPDLVDAVDDAGRSASSSWSASASVAAAAARTRSVLAVGVDALAGRTAPGPSEREPGQAAEQRLAASGRSRPTARLRATA